MPIGTQHFEFQQVPITAGFAEAEWNKVYLKILHMTSSGNRALATDLFWYGNSRDQECDRIKGIIYHLLFSLRSSA